MPTNNLFLVENSYQINDLLSRGLGREGIWIAVGPSAMHRLNKLGIAYKTPDDYCSWKEIEDLCVVQFEKLTKIFHELDSMMLSNYPELSEAGIRPFFYHLRQFASLADMLLCRSLQLKRVSENFKDATIYAYLNVRRPRHEELMFSENETIWGQLLALKNNGITNKVVLLTAKDIINRSWPGNTKKSKILYLLSKRILQNNVAIFSMIKSYKDKLVANSLELFDLMARPYRSDAIMVFNDQAEWSKVLKKIAPSGYRFYFLSSAYFGTRIGYKKGMNPDLSRRLWNLFAKGFNASFIDYVELLRSRFDYLVQATPQISLQVLNKIKRFIAGKKIKALFSSCGTGLDNYIIKRFCGRRGIKRFCYQHGALWHENRIVQRQDLFDLVENDYLMVYGDRLTDTYNLSLLARENSCKIIPVGMPSLDDINNGISKRGDAGFNILWPLTNYYNNYWYCGFSPPMNDRTYYKEQAVIADRLLRFLDEGLLSSLTIKLYPLERTEPPPWLYDLPRSEKIRIIYQYPDFKSLLSSHRIVLIDAPTTTLLQAIATKINVFVLSSVISPPIQDLHILSKRAICASSAAELMNELQGYLKTGQYKADTNSREYLKLYGTHLDDGRSDARAAEFINGILTFVQ